MKKGKEKKNFFKLLNPKNLQKEVHMYGYNFSWKTHWMILFFALLGVVAVSFLFQLKWGFMFGIGAGVLLSVPVLVRDMYIRMYEHKRFTDVITYLEQMLYSFQKNGKIIAALKETEECFEDGKMQKKIQQAIQFIEAGTDVSSNGLLRDGLEIIRESYGCAKMDNVHELLLNTEAYGGEMENSLYIVMDDLESWKRRTYILQKQKKQSHTDNILSILVAVLLCAVSLYVVDYMRVMFEAENVMCVLQNDIVQVTSMFFILLCIYVFVKSSRNLTRDWLREEELAGKAQLKQEYEDILKYDDKRERKKGILFSIPFLAAMILALVFQAKGVAVFSFLLAVLMLVQHKVGIKVARQSVTEAMYVAFPQWLMGMALLLQNNNVQVSIEKSMENAPFVLKKELEKLLERLQEEPDRLSSYTDFCDGFDIPEAKSCMKMLYSISESGTGNAAIQIHNLLKHVNEMQEQADKIFNETAEFKMKLIFGYPVCGAAVKMLIDMTVGMFVMFQLFGSIGG